MCCLTATASPSIATVITSTLGLSSPTTIKESPERPNIRYSVVQFNDSIENNFRWLEEELHDKQELMPKTLIFCKLKRNCSRIHSLLTTSSQELQKHVAIFHSDTPEARKEDILKDFVPESSNIRVLLATSAFGMGVHVYGLHTVVHFGPSRDFDDYFQESGRVGRDGQQSYAVIMNYSGRGKGVIKQEMREYVDSKAVTCRRKQLMSHYGEVVNIANDHNCCDICGRNCSCGDDGSCREGGGAGWAETVMVSSSVAATDVKYERTVTDHERETVHGLLHEYQQSLVNHESDEHLYTGASIASGFPTQLIDNICDNLHTIGNKEDLTRRFPFFNLGHANKVWTIIDQICKSAVNEIGIVCESDTNSTGSDVSLGDIESDDMEMQQAIISSQYSRVTLTLSNSSSED